MCRHIVHKSGRIVSFDAHTLLELMQRHERLSARSGSLSLAGRPPASPAAYLQVLPVLSALLGR